MRVDGVSGPARRHLGAGETEVKVRGPHLPDLVSFEQAEAGGVHVRDLRATKAIEHSSHVSVVFGRHLVELQAVELVDEDSEGSRCLLPMPMQEPGIGLANHQVRCAPARSRKAEQGFGLRVPLVVAVQECDEDSRI